MKVRSSILSQAIRCLYESFPPDMMVRLARMVQPGYDLHERTGFPPSIPIPPQVAADRIVKDMFEADRFFLLAETLIKVDAQGYMGRDYPVIQLRELIKRILAEGYVLDRVTGLFTENSYERVTPDWGRLAPGEEKHFALLRLDIAGNSLLVKGNSRQAVSSAYAALRDIVSRAVLKRNGRVWYWEGDGCLCGFLFGQKERSAILSGMEILNEVFLFNRRGNALSSPILLRLAAHAGPAAWSPVSAQLKKNELLREVDEIETAYTPVDSMSATVNLFLGQDRVLHQAFAPEKAAGSWKLRHYAVRLENA